ncbi:MAG TPA: transketolase C-terminal domain-containing protein, partial [bacterium]|nr:transketolase C-terminal domain-containing protein [bacterium]
LDAADLLSRSGISARVVNLHTIKPLDLALVERGARETGAIVTVEEHSILGGLGSAVCEAVAGLRPVPVERVGVQDTFGESGTPDALWQKYGLTPGAIADAAHRVLARKGARR